MKDRHESDYLLAPTHEEMFTLLVKDMYSSYKDLPVTLYQIQTKYRDEFRPRAGLIRGREFIMKDAYSFTVDEEGMRQAYMDERGAYERIFQRLDLKYVPVFAMSGPMGGSASEEFLADEEGMRQAYMDERGAYERIFQRLDLKYVPVFAMSGPMGGSASEEFLAPMPIGEDTFALAPSGKAWNVEALHTPEVEEIDASATPAATKRATPNARTIDEMVAFANAEYPREDGRDWAAADILKNVVVAVKHAEDDEHDEPWRELVVVGRARALWQGMECGGAAHARSGGDRCVRDARRDEARHAERAPDRRDGGVRELRIPERGRP